MNHSLPSASAVRRDIFVETQTKIIFSPVRGGIFRALAVDAAPTELEPIV